MPFDGGPAISVEYRDREWDIQLNSAGSTARLEKDTAALALELQAALNLRTPPVGLKLRVAPGTEAVVCPLSALIACPSYIAATFQGMSWLPCLEGGGDESEEEGDAPEAPGATTHSTHLPDLPGPPTDNPLLPPPLRSPLERDLSFVAACGSTASPSNGYGRTQGMTRPRPGSREGLGRPKSATPSDKSLGIRRLRPAKSEGFGRPVTALPSNHSSSGSHAWGLGSPHGFRCEETAQDAAASTGVRRPSTAPVMRRQSTSSLSGSMHDNGSFGERFGREGHVEVKEFGEGTRGRDSATHLEPAGGGDGLGAAGDVEGGDPSTGWGWCGAEPARECWV